MTNGKDAGNTKRLLEKVTLSNSSYENSSVTNGLVNPKVVDIEIIRSILTI